MASQLHVDNIVPSVATGVGIGTTSGTVTLNGSVNISNSNVTGGTLSGITSVSTTNLTINGNRYPVAGPLSNRNLIINGSMVVNQRGWTGAAGTTTNDAYTTDRFVLAHSHDGAVSAGQTSMNSTTGGNAYADGFQNALFFEVTTADASLAAGQYQLIQQRIEGYNVQGIKKGTVNAQPVTLSFWCRSTTTGTYIAELRDIDNGRFCPQAYTINVANTWEKKTLTYPADTTGVFNNDNGSSLEVYWWFAAGSDFTSGALATTWHTTSANRVVGQTNLLATVGNNFWLTGVQLEVGEVATPFEHRSFGDELARCSRYFQKSYAYEDAPGTVTSGNRGNDFVYLMGGSESPHINIKFNPEMRITPNVTTYSTATANTTGKLTASATDYNTSTNSTVNSAKNYLVYAGSVTAADDVYVAWTADSEL